MASSESCMRNELEERLLFEQIISDLSAKFIRLPYERLDDEIEIALKTILEFFQVDRCALLRVLPDKKSWKITHLAHSEHAPPIPKGTELPQSIHPWAYEKLAIKGEVVSFVRVEDMPDEAHVDKQTWIDWGIRSNLVIPILKSESLVHIIAINAVKREYDWPEEFIPRLQLLGEIFVSALERRTAEQVLRQSGARLSLAVNSAEAGLWELDCSTGIFWATEQARKIFDLGRDDVISMDRIEALVHRDDLERFRQAVTRALGDKEPVDVEYQIHVGDGRLKWISSKGRPYFKTTGEPERLLGASIDITERKKMEEQLRKRLQDIEQLKQQLEKENIYLREEIELQSSHEEIVGRSPAMKNILAQIEQVAGTDATVLIEGETGTGKELLARAVHRLSGRKDRPLVTVNCAALPPTLIESELFGREKGAYTGALTRMMGRFELADGATLFLDEIGDLPQDVQSKLLRVLEHGRFERLGSVKPLQVNVRVIAATNRDLTRDVDAGKFRKDLYYRLNVFPITVPPLRERPEDIPLLVWTFVRQFEKKMGKRIEHIPLKRMEDLQHYPWPGNARELRNVVEHAMILSSGKTLDIHTPRTATSAIPANLSLEDAERQHILGVLEKSDWRLSGKGGAAEVLGLKRTTLQSKMKKLGIQRHVT